MSRLPRTGLLTVLANRTLAEHVAGGMENDEHVAEPGLVVLDIAAADEVIAAAVMDALQRQWATSGMTPVRRTPGEARVRSRAYADLRHRPDLVG